MKKILVAEDDTAIVEVVKIILENEGYHITSTDSEETIHQVLRDNTPDLILLDIWLSGYDGGVIAKKIKSRQETSGIPIVMLSASNDTERVSKEAGADDYLLKPFNIGDLLAMVQKYCR